MLRLTFMVMCCLSLAELPAVEIGAADASLIGRLIKPFGDAGTIPLPEKAARDKALATIKSHYASDYLQKKDSQKKAFAAKLQSEAKANADDPAIVYDMLDESARVACEVEDYASMATAIQAIQETFKGFDPIAFQKNLLTHTKVHPAAGALLSLMDDPSNKAANLTLGKSLCFVSDLWAPGLHALTEGSDVELARIASLDLANPTAAIEQRKVAEAWFEAGKEAAKKTFIADKLAMWARARVWFTRALAETNGLAKDDIEKALAEINGQVSTDVTDFTNLTPEQWGKMKGAVVNVQARIGRTDSGMILTAGQRVRVVAHPTEMWTFTFGAKDYTVPAIGLDPKLNVKGMESNFRYGSLIMQLDNKDPVLPGIITGPGHLYFIPNNKGTDGKNSIHVKILLMPKDN